MRRASRSTNRVGSRRGRRRATHSANGHDAVGSLVAATAAIDAAEISHAHRWLETRTKAVESEVAKLRERLQLRRLLEQRRESRDVALQSDLDASLRIDGSARSPLRRAQQDTAMSANDDVAQAILTPHKDDASHRALRIVAKELRATAPAYVPRRARLTALHAEADASSDSLSTSSFQRLLERFGADQVCEDTKLYKVR